eukprot:GILK01013813.1.p1 GENE.GILK01013813.1~~GILK01013813.1.p1  ORF type:complete len:1270 (-),score=282.56 GILK01013813.1:104-3649(-)
MAANARNVPMPSYAEDDDLGEDDDPEVVAEKIRRETEQMKNSKDKKPKAKEEPKKSVPSQSTSGAVGSRVKVGASTIIAEGIKLVIDSVHVVVLADRFDYFATHKPTKRDSSVGMDPYLSEPLPIFEVDIGRTLLTSCDEHFIPTDDLNKAKLIKLDEGREYTFKLLEMSSVSVRTGILEDVRGTLCDRVQGGVPLILDLPLRIRITNSRMYSKKASYLPSLKKTVDISTHEFHLHCCECQLKAIVAVMKDIIATYPDNRLPFDIHDPANAAALGSLGVYLSQVSKANNEKSTDVTTPLSSPGKDQSGSDRNQSTTPIRSLSFAAPAGGAVLPAASTVPIGAENLQDYLMQSSVGLMFVKVYTNQLYTEDTEALPLSPSRTPTEQKVAYEGIVTDIRVSMTATLYMLHALSTGVVLKEETFATVSSMDVREICTIYTTGRNFKQKINPLIVTSFVATDNPSWPEWGKIDGKADSMRSNSTVDSRLKHPSSTSVTPPLSASSSFSSLQNLSVSSPSLPHPPNASTSTPVTVAPVAAVPITNDMAVPPNFLKSMSRSTSPVFGGESTHSQNPSSKAAAAHPLVRPTAVSVISGTGPEQPPKSSSRKKQSKQKLNDEDRMAMDNLLNSLPSRFAAANVQKHLGVKYPAVMSVRLNTYVYGSDNLNKPFDICIHSLQAKVDVTSWTRLIQIITRVVSGEAQYIDESADQIDADDDPFLIRLYLNDIGIEFPIQQSHPLIEVQKGEIKRRLNLGSDVSSSPNIESTNSPTKNVVTHSPHISVQEPLTSNAGTVSTADDRAFRIFIPRTIVTNATKNINNLVKQVLTLSSFPKEHFEASFLPGTLSSSAPTGEISNDFADLIPICSDLGIGGGCLCGKTGYFRGHSEVPEVLPPSTERDEYLIKRANAVEKDLKRTLTMLDKANNKENAVYHMDEQQEQTLSDRDKLVRKLTSGLLVSMRDESISELVATKVELAECKTMKQSLELELQRYRKQFFESTIDAEVAIIKERQQKKPKAKGKEKPLPKTVSSPVTEVPPASKTVLAEPVRARTFGVDSPVIQVKSYDRGVSETGGGEAEEGEEDYDFMRLCVESKMQLALAREALDLERQTKSSVWHAMEDQLIEAKSQIAHLKEETEVTKLKANFERRTLEHEKNQLSDQLADMRRQRDNLLLKCEQLLHQKSQTQKR